MQHGVFLLFFSFWAKHRESETPQSVGLYSQLSSSRITWMLHTKLWKTTCQSSASHKTTRRFLWHICDCIILREDILHWHKSNAYSKFIFTWEICSGQCKYPVFLSVYKLCLYKHGKTPTPHFRTASIKSTSIVIRHFSCTVYSG